MTQTPIGATKTACWSEASTATRRPNGMPRRRVAAICKAAAIGIAITAISATAALARGGGHFGGHIGHFGGSGSTGAIETPAYVLITTMEVSDKDAFTAAFHSLGDAVLPFEGRVISDSDHPPAWEGAAALHVTMLQFNSADAAQRWKTSDAYKAFDEQLKKMSTSSIQQFAGVPTARPAAMASARGHGRGLDPRAFEPIVKDYDATLSKMHGICRGC